MYKVFLNERAITIARSGNPDLIKDAVIIENLKTPAEAGLWFLRFVESKIQTVTILHADPEKFWHETFIPAFSVIFAAGGVVIRKNKLLFIVRNEKWDLPKGKIESGETDREAALREVAEECGISGHQISAMLPSTFHIYQSPHKETRGQWIFKETRWFEMNYTSLDNGTPETAENITEIKWFAKNELDEVLQNTWANLKPVIEIYLQKP